MAEHRTPPGWELVQIGSAEDVGELAKCERRVLGGQLTLARHAIFRAISAKRNLMHSGWAGGPAAGTANLRLLAIFGLTMMWNILLGIDGRIFSTAEYTVLHWATLLAYPAVVVAVVRILLERGLQPPDRISLHAAVRWMPLLIFGITLGLVIRLPATLSPANTINSDVTASIVCASRQVLQGRDPYLQPELACLHSLRAPVALGTPLQAGVLAHQTSYPTVAEEAAVARSVAKKGWRTSAYTTFGYPPMAYVWMLPAATGNLSAWVGYTMVAALVWLAIAGLGAGPLWPALVLVLLVQVGDGGLMSAALHGDGEFFGYALATLALLWIDRRRLSGLLMGIAMACHPLAWVIWFGYALFTKTLPGFRDRMLWSLGTALVLIVPWLVLERHALEGIVGLVIQPTFGQGLGVVSLFAPAPPLVLRHALTAAVVVGFAGLCLLAWFRRGLLPALPVVAMSFLWLGWRSEVSYLSEIFPLAAAMTIGLYRLQVQGRREQVLADVLGTSGTELTVDLS